jgi:hypothetical protein
MFWCMAAALGGLYLFALFMGWVKDEDSEDDDR